MVAFGQKSARACWTAAVIGLAAGTAAVAQQSASTPPPAAPNSTSSLRLPQSPQVFGSAIPSVVKATAIVNGDVITQTDVEQRVALLAMANGSEIPVDELDRVRQQVLRNLIDEQLQIQAAKDAEIEVRKSDIDRTVERVAGNVQQTPVQLESYLAARGSSIRSLRRQIEGEIAWQRLQRAKIESSVTVGDEEVKAVLDQLMASKGSDEYRVGEIFISATTANQAEAAANAARILEQLRNGASFAGYARQFSEASTAAVGGDLGWVRAEQLPAPLAAQVRQMTPGTVSNLIPVPGGISIIALQDRRKILAADPRDAVLSLKQVSINFPAGTRRDQAEPIVARFADAARNVGGCGGADRIATEFKGEVVTSDQVKMRDLPASLQQMMLRM